MSQGLLCFGGSFNPIHNGHLRCCREVARARKYARVLLIPSAQPPHKSGALELASAEDRATMCRVATEGKPLFEVSDIELHRSGPSYTIDTVQSLKAAGHREVSWLIGADMLMLLPMWHRSRELIREANMLVMNRPGCAIQWDELPQEFRGLQANVVEAPLLDISATEIRQRIREGKSVEGLLPEAVIRYINEKGLYRG